VSGYDAVVAGAGPSGSTAAYYLAKEGYRVALVDRARFPRDKACGGGLCIHIREFDHITSNWDDFLEAECLRGVVFGPDMEMVDYRRDEPFFYNIRRRTFDHRLVNFAVDAGAELIEGNGMRNFTIRDDGVTTRLRDGTELESRVIIGAGGTYDRVAQHIRKVEGFPMWGDNDIATALYAEIDVGEEFLDEAFGTERTAMAHLKYDHLDGYGWAFPKRSVLNIGIGGPRSVIKRHKRLNPGWDERSYFEHYIRTLKRQGYFPEHMEVSRRQMGGSNIPVGMGIKRSVTDRALVVGDAGGFVSPLSGEGIYYALDSGRLAAQSLAPLLERDTLDRNALMDYHHAWQHKWGADLEWLRVAWNLLMFMPSTLVRYAAIDEESKEMFTHMFLGSLPAAEIKNRIFYLIARDFLKYDALRLLRGGASAHSSEAP